MSRSEEKRSLEGKPSSAWSNTLDESESGPTPRKTRMSGIRMRQELDESESGFNNQHLERRAG